MRRFIQDHWLVLFSSFVIVGSLFAFSAQTFAEDAPPNFVIIFADDQGYNDVGCFGSPDIRTPRLDQMAEEGMRFTDFYVSASVCSASRSALMTGCYCDRVGVQGVFFPNRGETGLHPNEITIAEVLKTKGYATACIGKWHLGDEKPFLPTNQGFDSYFGIPYSNDMTVNPNMDVATDVVWREGMTLETMRDFDAKKKNWVPLLRDEAVVEYPCDQTTLTQRYTNEAIEFIDANQDNPFFLYLPHTMPHIPLFVSEDFVGINEARDIYGCVIEELDYSVGRVIDALQERGLDENTIVIFTSDNGPWLNLKNAATHAGRADPLRDGKFTTYEGGMREPFIIWAPGRTPAGTVCSELAGTIDILPTFAELAGAEVPSDRIIDGRSIVPLIEGRPDAVSPRETVFYRTNGVRVGPWKLLTGGRSTVKSQPAGPFPELYNLEEDIAEENNVAADHPEIVARLTAILDEYKADLAANARPTGKLSELETAE